MRAQTVARVLARRRLAGNTLTAPRTFFSFLKKAKTQNAQAQATLGQDDLFHPLSQSPFAPLREKADRVKKLSICPVSNDRHGEKLPPSFDCPDCGWPTHASQERWQEGRAEHDEYCGRLREVNEDEHDVRSGRRMKEFDDMPGTSQQHDRANRQANSPTRQQSLSHLGIHSFSREISPRSIPIEPSVMSPRSSRTRLRWPGSCTRMGPSPRATVA